MGNLQDAAAQNSLLFNRHGSFFDHRNPLTKVYLPLQAVSCIISSMENQTKEDRQKLESAVAALKTGNKTAARQIFSEILRQNPDCDDAWVGLALCADDPQRRKELLQRALRLNPAHAYARSALARLDGVPAPPPAKDPKIQRRWMEV